MKITLDISDAAHAALTRQAAKRKLGIEAYASDLVTDAVRQRAQAAGARIRALRKGVTLGGNLTIRQLIDEGRPS